MTKPVRSIVLSGGGARGAYEAGVLAYILRELPKEVLGPAPLRILCGTSVGAIHACFLAACAHMEHSNINQLLDVWRAFKLDDMLRLAPRDLMRLPWEMHHMMRRKTPKNGLFVNATVLHNVITRDIPWAHTYTNMQNGLFDGLTVSATHIASGKTVVFIDRLNGGVPPWTRDSRRVARGTRIGPMHALASAAIPMLFPAIAIDGAYYCDGGLRQNTPLSPALRMGADRVLVIPVGHGRDFDVPAASMSQQEEYPGPSLLIGKVMNALLLDHLDYDLAQLRGFNRLLEDGKVAFGDSFLTELSRTAERIRGAGYRHVDTMVVRPSRDLGEMAAEFVASGGAKVNPLATWVLGKISGEDAVSNSDLLSYMLFDGGYASALIELGMTDADAARQALIEFFRD